MKNVAVFAFCLVLQSVLAYSQNISTIAGTGVAGFGGDGGPATAAHLANPQKAVADASGNVYISDYSNNRVRKVSTSGIISTVVGDWACDTTGDGGPAVAAKICHPMGLAIDAPGNLYIADFGTSVVRKVSPTGIITRFAGNGALAYNGDGGAATLAAIGNPVGLAVDAVGNVFIADGKFDVVRKVNTSGIISTVAGNGITGSAADGALTTSSPLNGVRGVAVDAAGNLYITETLSFLLRKVNTSGILSTVSAGVDVWDVALDAAGNIYWTDWGGDRVFRMHDTTRSIIAGNGTAGYTGDGGPATLATFDGITGISVSTAGYIYVADVGNHCIRKFASGTVGVPEKEQLTASACPNPTTGKFVITLPYGGNKQVTIVDVLGRTVLQEVSESEELDADLTGEVPGSYFIAVTTGKGVYRGQLVVVH